MSQTSELRPEAPLVKRLYAYAFWPTLSCCIRYKREYVPLLAANTGVAEASVPSLFLVV